MYNLTPNQKDLLRSIVAWVRDEKMPEEFSFMWGDNAVYVHFEGRQDFLQVDGVTQGALDALVANGLLHMRVSSDSFDTRHCTLTGQAYDAVDTNFAAPDTSFVRHLTPLADVIHFDTELKQRCLPILGAGAADPKLWDSAVRTAAVVLEERLRRIGSVTDTKAIGRELVNRIFGKTGTLATRFAHDSERESYRDLYAGIVGAFRNPSAHRLVDPTPNEGGAFIVFVNLLLGKLEEFQ